MTRTATVCLALCLLAAAVQAQAPKPVDLPLASWQAQSQQPADGKITVGPEGFVLTRGAAGDPYMLRVFQDVTVKPGGLYVFTYRAKVDGDGNSSGIIYSGDAQGVWDEAHPRYTDAVRKGDFTTVKTVIAASPTTVKFRLDVRANGVNTTVTYRDVKFEEIGEQQEVTLVPSAAAVTLDGKLDDPLWATAAHFSPFRVLGNVESPASVANEAAAAIKDGNLYLAYRLSEPNVAGMKMTKPPAGGDSPVGIYQDDCAETFLSTDRVSYSHVIVNAAGARHWEQRNLGRPSATWFPTAEVEFSPDWEAKAAVGKGEWTCELRVRLSDLFREAVGGEQKLYVNFTRHRTQGKEENLTYAPIVGQFYAVPREFVPITLQLPPVTGPVATNAISGKFTKLLGVPDLLMAGNPVKLAKQKTGVFRLPAQPSISVKGFALDPVLQQQFTQALTVAGGGAAQIVLQLGDVFSDKALNAAERAKLQSPEAVKLDLAPGKAVITGRTREGALRGVATLMLMANRARLKDAALPALTLWDAPRLPFRGLMVQLDRRIVDVAFAMRLNKLLVYLDSFGGPTLFPFEGYPIGGKRTTKQELVDLFNYARARGIEPIPYFASWGRTQYLKVMPGGVDLLVDDKDVLQPTYRNLDVANPQACKVMLALQQEIIDTLHPQSFCIAMDEAHFGNMISPAAKAKGWKQSDWYATALNMNAEFLRKQKIRMIIWGDMIEPTHNGPAMDICGPELLKRLPKDMTIFDWEYDGSREVTEDFPSIKMFREAGLPTLGCPWYAPKGVARLAHSIAKYGGDGLLLTAWNSSSPEAMPSEWIRACALTAYLGWSPEDCELSHFTFVPDAIMEGAAYWQRVNFPAGPTKSVAAPPGLVSGEALIKLLGLPAGTDPGFIATPFRNVRGASVNVFRQNGQPAAVALPGRECAVVRNGDFADGVADWSADVEAEDTTFTADQGTLKVTRVKGNEFRRVSQDLRLDPKREYLVRYRVKVDGPGTARLWSYSGDDKFRYDESKCVHSAANEREWTTKAFALPPGYATLRLSLTVDGPGTTGWFDDIEVVEKGVDPATLAPAKAVIPVNATARVVTFMHATNQQVLTDDMHANAAKYGSIIPAQYRVNYGDGTVETIPLAYRVNIVAANDPTLGRQCDVGLFGTIGGAAFMNLPTFTWLNPHPEKTIANIEARSGSSGDMTLLVFGLALD